MDIKYTLDEDDFLVYQLYNAATSDLIKKKRNKTKVRGALIYALLGLLYLFTDNVTLGVVFIALGIAWYFIYPIWEGGYYRRYYKNFIQENCSEKINRPFLLSFRHDVIVSSINTVESRINIGEVKEITELPTVILVTLNIQETFILPKDKITEIHALITFLKDFATQMNIPYHLALNWVWK